jgi:hypothetical protein
LYFFIFLYNLFFMKHFILLLATSVCVLVAPGRSLAGVGIFNARAIINGTSYSANTNLGTVAPGAIILNGATVSSFQNGGDDVCTMFLNYTVSGGGPSGSGITVPYVNQTGTSPNFDKNFSLTGQSINVSNLGNGTYTLTVSHNLFGRFGSVTCFGSTNPFTTGTLGTPLVFTFTIDVSLPVSLSSFKVKSNGAAHIVAWITEQEKEHHFFAVERSKDARAWQELGRVASRESNSTQGSQYAFEDSKPLKGVNYYRLRQVDLDGRVTYSSIVSLTQGKVFTGSIHPNPVREQLQVTMPDEEGTLLLYDMVGKLLIQRQISDAHTLPMADYRTGTYHVVLLSAEGAFLHAERIVKQ